MNKKKPMASMTARMIEIGLVRRSERETAMMAYVKLKKDSNGEKTKGKEESCSPV
jgi:hypothetical protein